jgi:hypothetical protein
MCRGSANEIRGVETRYNKQKQLLNCFSAKVRTTKERVELMRQVGSDRFIVLLICFALRTENLILLWILMDRNRKYKYTSAS